MDELSKLSASGGNDYYEAGTYSIFGSDVATITLTGSSGTADITVNGITKTATFNSSLTQTATDFVTANAAAYLAAGIVLTSDTADLIFTVNATEGYPIITVDAEIENKTGNLDGTIVKSGGRLPHPVYAVTVLTAAIISACKTQNDLGIIAPFYPRFLGVSLAVVNTLIVFEYPVTEIVLDSGTVLFNFIK